MQFLTNLISKIGLFVFFILLEIAAIYFMATRSDFHKNAIGVKSMAVNGYITDKTTAWREFWNAPQQNKDLIAENARLKNLLARKSVELVANDSVKTRIDSLYKQKYSYRTAEIVDYSIRKKNNYFFLNKGKKDGVHENMAVVSSNTIVGAVLNSSDHYASVISLLHSRTNIKARIKGQSRFGIIKWPGEDHRELELTEIPKYLNVKIGDTVMTAGASAIYPEGLLIGHVKSLEPNDDTGDYDITVETFDDLSTIRNVYVVENLDQLDIQKAKEKDDVITQ